MPTPSEKKALAFVATVVLLGGAVRVVRAGSSSEPTPIEQQALARQATAADSAASRAKPKKARGSRTSRSARDTIPRVVGGVATVPRTFARPDDPNAHAPYGTRSEQLGFPPPAPRIDVGSPQRAEPATRGRVDLDHATAAEIEALPRIGPALARRIVASREASGPFRSLDNLRRVKGLGPATIALLKPLVSFGGQAPAP